MEKEIYRCHGKDIPLDDYLAFMYNPENEYHCSECVENYGATGIGQLPCGQQNCWVTCHVRQQEWR